MVDLELQYYVREWGGGKCSLFPSILNTALMFSLAILHKESALDP